MATRSQIRELEATDLDGLLALYEHLHEHDEPLPARAQVEAVWGDLIADPKTATLGLWQGDDLVASCVVTIVPNMTRGVRPYGVIENVVTHSEHRQRGLGRSVMQNALDRCWRAGCYKVMLMSGMHRREVHAFYERLGFDPAAKQAFLIKPPLDATD